MFTVPLLEANTRGRETKKRCEDLLGISLDATGQQLLDEDNRRIFTTTRSTPNQTVPNNYREAFRIGYEDKSPQETVTKAFTLMTMNRYDLKMIGRFDRPSENPQICPLYWIIELEPNSKSYTIVLKRLYGLNTYANTYTSHLDPSPFLDLLDVLEKAVCHSQTLGVSMEIKAGLLQQAQPLK